MLRGRPAQQVIVSSADKKTLRALVTAKKTEQRLVLRANIILMASEGRSTQNIAKALDTSKQTVSLWRSRFAFYGIDGLSDKGRSGRPRTLSDATRLEILSLACEPLTGQEGRVTPTLNELTARAIKRGAVLSISRSHLHRILQEGDIHPHRVQQWLHSPDPEFRYKVNTICELYRTAPKNSVVLSIDEKSGIQAIERKNLGRPARKGQLYKEEFEYIRHGTQCLIAALDVHTGRVFGQCRDRRTQIDLLEFMQEVAKIYPTREVHVIWDNLNTHRNKEVWDKFNAEQNYRFHFHFTPIHASWVNQIELVFGIYSRRVLRHASHKSIKHLQERTKTFIEERNQHAKPFKWTFNGFHLQTGEKGK
jgi:transposase